MKFLQIEEKGENRLCVLLGNEAIDLKATYLTGGGRSYRAALFDDALTFIENMDESMELLEETMEIISKGIRVSLPIPERLKPPITYPRKLLCLAGNYAEHIREGGGTAYDKSKVTPRVFMKPPSTTVIGHGEPIVIPRNGNRIDWEAELGVVIGRRGKFISAEEAYDYVFGYTIVNDVSERRLKVPKEREPREGDRWFDWLNGKWFDTFAPMGPWIVTKDEIPDPHSLRISLTVNGEVMQDSNTNHMIFTVPELIQFISTLLTLEPGDVISTGTPEGAGAARGIFLKKGELV
ncbi:TPA: FAA hydrolase family protein [Candidatus Poribacteria bacterium]|nr:FAA hydrolase family protein [Candidatus Poribacteria bacterium]HEX29953.1 FAA hydrolase family protein [Candidatus Poribacteria bacterium]